MFLNYISSIRPNSAILIKRNLYLYVKRAASKAKAETTQQPTLPRIRVSQTLVVLIF